jgi:uncharacterized protein (TIRG00374 family)
MCCGKPPVPGRRRAQPCQTADVAQEPTERRPSSREETGASHRRRPLLRSAVSLVAGAIALYLYVPKVLSSASSWRSISDLDPRFAALALGLQMTSWVCLWALDRVALRCRDWFTVACAQLAGNALGRVVPGSATPFSVALLGDAGMDHGRAAAALTTSTLLQIGTALALPFLALPALIAGAPIDHSLLMATYIGLAALVTLVIVATAALRTDGLLTWVGKTVQAVLNSTLRRRRPVRGLDRRLLADRDFVRSTLASGWRAALLAAVGNTLFDFVSLLASLRAVHADPRPSLVVLAYAAAEVLTQVPLTPGGLGFVEAGLIGTLTLAGVSASAAAAATLLYRLFSYWLPIPLGGLAYVLFRRRYPERAEPAPGEET